MKLSTNNLLKIAIAVLVSGLLGIFSACTGPEGPAGTNGADGTAVCKKCHGDANVEFKWSQYDISKHGTGVIYEEEAGRLQCGGCHTGKGFAEAATLKQDDPTTMATGKISCSTCHDIHDKYDPTDFKLRITDGFKLRQFGTTDGMVDFKTGNLCAKCHQARNYVHGASGYDTLKASKNTTYARFGPHYGVVANVVAMKGLENLAGSQTLPTSNPHMSLAKGCVSCHMGKDASNPAAGGHTFTMPEANLVAVANDDANGCKGCHADAANQFKTGSVFNGVKADLAAIRQKFIDLKMLDISQTAGENNTYNVLGEYAAATDKAPYPVYKADDPKWQAFINYLFLVKDRSNGVHNPAYVKAMVANIKQALGM